MSTIQPLGPEGVRARMQQIEARLAALNGEGAPQFPTINTTGSIPALVGGSLRPLSAFGDGTTVTATGESSQLRSMIESAALDHNIDPRLLDALVQTESSYDPSARSRAGGMGLTQLMPDTARSLGVGNPFDPAQNLQGGAKYLSQMISQFGDLPKALAAYNAGPNSVIKYGGVPPFTETVNYVDRIMKLYTGRSRP